MTKDPMTEIANQSFDAFLKFYNMKVRLDDLVENWRWRFYGYRDAFCEINYRLQKDTNPSVCKDSSGEIIQTQQPVERTELPERAPAKRIDEILQLPYTVMTTGRVNYEIRRDFLQLATEVKHLRVDLAEATKREIIEDEEEHLENCDCCQNFMRMEAKYDALKKESNALAAIKKYVEAHHKVGLLPEVAYLDSTKMDILVAALNEKAAAFNVMLDLISGLKSDESHGVDSLERDLNRIAALSKIVGDK